MAQPDPDLAGVACRHEPWGHCRFEARVAQVEAVAAAVAKFENPELQIAAFRFLLGDRHTAPNPNPAKNDHEEQSDQSEEQTQQAADEVAGSNGSGSGSTRRRNPGKAGTSKNTSKKQTLTFAKSLNFYSTGGELGLSLKDFTDAHPASNAVHKAVSVVYWLSKELDVSPISVDHVYSAFKTLSWPIPSSLLNTLQKGGSENFLDTKKSTDIKLTTHGENLVEFQLVPKTES
ncbi:hypothetical protein [Microbacterium sp. zg.Y1084]|uniref:hypothetical protein n=1 Tax=Microbacterium sp. zg.Y1084 TaxID=2969667 RepID=UPI00214B97DA|nr:hypothetical protein [Microbacterium sp. zg.Y1084]MCR2814204.1 hypothetical protein [Microbacterium sp. zg.Y1084]